MTTTYRLFEMTPKSTIQRAETELLAEAEAIAAGYSRWYIVERIETEKLINLAVVARSYRRAEMAAKVVRR